MCQVNLRYLIYSETTGQDGQDDNEPIAGFVNETDACVFMDYQIDRLLYGRDTKTGEKFHA